MKSDDVEVFHRLVERFGDGASNEGVREAVEAVFAQSIALGNLLVDGVGFDVSGNRGVEGGVEESNVSCLWELVVDGSHNSQGTCIVPRMRSSAENQSQWAKYRVHTRVLDPRVLQGHGKLIDLSSLHDQSLLRARFCGRQIRCPLSA